MEALSEELTELHAGGEMMKMMNETITYMLATRYLWGNRFIVPAVIFKAVKVMAGICLPNPRATEFVGGAV